MTLKVKQGGVFTAVGGGGGAPAGAWTRPGDWLALPTVNEGDQKVVGLVPVYEGDSNFVGVTCAGAYTVDWGDGSAAVNANAGATTIKNITWASVSSGTLTSGGYRQAVVTVTPQAGSNLTSVTLNPSLLSGAAVSSSTPTPWLDIKIAGANVSALGVSSQTRPARLLQQFEYVGPSALTSGSVLTSASALRNVVGTQWTATITNFTSLFNGCSALQTIPTIDMTAATSAASLFLGCSALQTVPLLNTAGVLDWSNTFSGCGSLAAVPALNSAAGTTFTNVFLNCQNLQVGALAGTSKTISYASCKLSATQLDAIYSNLASGVAGQTITVTGNHGVATDTPSIATGKGWTVTG